MNTGSIKCAGEPTTQLYIYIGADTSKENTRFVSFSINTLIGSIEPSSGVHVIAYFKVLKCIAT
jgi:hypothetical protein